MADNLTNLLDGLARAAQRSSGLPPAAQVRRRGDARTRHTRVAASLAGVVAVAVAVGVPAIGLRPSRGRYPTPAGGATGAVPPVTPPPSWAPSPQGPPPSAPQGPPASAPRTTTGPAGSPTGPASPLPAKVFATITDLPPNPTLVVGGGWLQFTATIANGTGTTQTQVAPLLSLGHCTCTTDGMAPTGQMQAFDPVTGTWYGIAFDREGFGMDYLYIGQVAAADLPPGGVRSVRYRIRIDAQQQPAVFAGAGGIDVTVVQHPGTASARIVVPAASVTVRYATG